MKIFFFLALIAIVALGEPCTTEQKARGFVTAQTQDLSGNIVTSCRCPEGAPETADGGTTYCICASNHRVAQNGVCCPEGQKAQTTEGTTPATTTCVCEDGSDASDGCDPVVITEECPAGSTRNGDGNCICEGSNTAPVEGQCPCPEGSTRHTTNDGSVCLCENGSAATNDGCTTVVNEECPAGSHRRETTANTEPDRNCYCDGTVDRIATAEHPCENNELPECPPGSGRRSTTDTHCYCFNTMNIPSDEHPCTPPPETCPAGSARTGDNPSSPCYCSESDVVATSASSCTNNFECPAGSTRGEYTTTSGEANTATSTTACVCEDGTLAPASGCAVDGEPAEEPHSDYTISYTVVDQSCDTVNDLVGTVAAILAEDGVNVRTTCTETEDGNAVVTHTIELSEDATVDEETATRFSGIVEENVSERGFILEDVTVNQKSSAVTIVASFLIFIAVALI